jgi:phospholipid/cholesterol/gamma-HCH transport system ATP-binding protein
MLFDDSTTGLDPVIASSVDDEIVKLRDLQQGTSLVVTQQIRDAFYIATHKAVRAEGGIRIEDVGDRGQTLAEFMVLHEGQIHFLGTANELLASKDPYLERFLYRTLPPW